jgi:hypothetical protein
VAASWILGFDIASYGMAAGIMIGLMLSLPEVIRKMFQVSRLQKKNHFIK